MQVIMNEKEFLVKGLTKVQQGFAFITKSVLTYTENQEIIEEIFNGDNYAHERFFFTKSFDEESALFTSFVEEYSDHLGYNYITFKHNELENENLIVMLLQGFNSALQGLIDINQVSKENKELKFDLKHFELSEYDYNPFKLYGLSEFEKKFRGWRRAFITELTNKLGRYKMEKYNDLIEVISE